MRLQQSGLPRPHAFGTARALGNDAGLGAAGTRHPSGSWRYGARNAGCERGAGLELASRTCSARDGAIPSGRTPLGRSACYRAVPPLHCAAYRLYARRACLRPGVRGQSRSGLGGFPIRLSGVHRAQVEGDRSINPESGGSSPRFAHP